jgi:CsoR family transcriptional regulator, copper-sensing transcriptional repressor
MPPEEHLKDSLKKDAKRRLSRMAGQLNGIQRMVDDERYCVDVLTQIAALRAALDQFGLLMLSTHLEDCVYGHDSEDHCTTLNREERLQEIRTTLNRFLK